MKFRRLTSNLQLALHLVHSEIVDGPARVSAPIKQAWLANIQSQHALFVLHQILGVFTDDHTVLHPNDLGLENSVCWRRRQIWRDGGGSVHTEGEDVGRVGEQREEGRGRGEIRSTFGLDKSLQIRKDVKKKKVCSKIFLLHLLF